MRKQELVYLLHMSQPKITSFTGLVAWQKAHQFVIEVLKAWGSMPKYDAVRAQLERAAISITSNIAEGFGRQQTNDKKRFYIIARGSAYEVQNQLLIARDTNKLSLKDFQNLSILSLDSVKLLHGLIRSLEKSRHATS